jgi:hypothetical protein
MEEARRMKDRWNDDPQFLIILINAYYQWMVSASTHNYNNTQVLVDAYESYFEGQLTTRDKNE